MNKDDSLPVLYILMRDDMESMNPGKAMAQASHASNMFIWESNQKTDMAATKMDLVMQWAQSTDQGFGTVIVLALSEDSLYTIVDMAKRLSLLAGVVHDPTYPIRDGGAIHYIPVNTCGYVFGDKNDEVLSTLLQDFKLHP